MARTVDPNRATEKWARGMSSAGQAYKDGINAVQVNPMQLAAQPDAMQRYLDGVQRSVASGKRARKLNAVDPSFWKSQSIQYGGTGLANAASKSKPKVAAHFNEWASKYSQVSAAVAQLPKGGLGNATARSGLAIQMLMQMAGSA